MLNENKELAIDGMRGMHGLTMDKFINKTETEYNRFNKRCTHVIIHSYYLIKALLHNNRNIDRTLKHIQTYHVM